MGRELVRQLVAEPCNVAMCDVWRQGMVETQRLCEHSAVRRRTGTIPAGSTCDSTNAGVGNSGSMIAYGREE